MDLEGFLDEALDGRPAGRGYGSTFRKAVRALDKAKVSFALAGSLAYSIRVEPTYTKDADILVDPEAWRTVFAALRTAGFAVEGDRLLARATDPETGVWIDLMFGMGDPEESARETASREVLLRVHAPVIGINYILWMYLLSDQGRHKDRAIEIIRRGLADIHWLDSALAHDGDRRSQIRLRKLIAEAAKPRSGWKPKQDR